MTHSGKIFIAIVFFTALTVPVAPQTGGQFAITQSITSNGGGNANGGVFGLAGTAGQNVAGTNSTGGVFVVNGGFWQVFFAPTAASVSISGRALTANAQGVKGAIVILYGGALTEPRFALTNNFGYYSFADVPVGETYILSASHKQHIFNPNTLVLNVNETFENANFTAME